MLPYTTIESLFSLSLGLVRSYTRYLVQCAAIIADVEQCRDEQSQYRATRTYIFTRQFSDTTGDSNAVVHAIWPPANDSIGYFMFRVAMSHTIVLREPVILTQATTQVFRPLYQQCKTC
jgi:hypothetical protein